MFLILDLAPEAAVHLQIRGEDSPRSMLAFGRAYIELGRATTDGMSGLGFYDWLRDRSGNVVGLRLSFYERNLDSQACLPARTYIKRVHDGIVEIMFSEGATVDEDASMDQEFLDSRLYRAADGAIAMLFDAEALSADELRSLGKDT